MANISGYKRGPLRNFDPILRKWIEVNETYCRKSNWNDIPWGYNERASLSTFAAAAWLAGGIALEEYSEMKGLKVDQKTWVRGRCDLYISINKKACILEAKIVWPSLTTKDWQRAIAPTLNSAREAVRWTWAPSGERKLGLLIVSPYFHKDRDSNVDALIGNFVRYLKNRTDIASAWIFPRQTRYFHWTTRNKWKFPGSAILLKPLRS